ncbi:hypothetical protein Q4F19_08005 [Sphingomonas sp. BIUV-7]|uniref:DUF6894 domain-containing protein n=1 Tax=Sphingomonas natans TaxID=3063330 RepID=A0ABT8Y7N0_9SPHN|nr:hypothetical protein [Sphingomonas sp. BIUV-7]MDO6414323.1 hypothetical protein [Sphingomonas sp. BIUV-7]
MAKFFIKLDGIEQREIEIDAETVEEARDRAIVTLGGYLQENPSYADHRQWRVDIQDALRRHQMYIIVACVEAAPRPNLASYESVAAHLPNGSGDVAL